MTINSLLPRRERRTGNLLLSRSAQLAGDFRRLGTSDLFRPVAAILLVALFSALYFTRTYFAASEKTFWYDELWTLYVCRFPTFHAAWAAVVSGADYNPPFFYVIHRASRAVFGEGLLAFRIPEIVSFWIFCVCLFRFVSRRGGLLAGWVAMVLPALTGAYFYAYEARPHGLVLGFCGLALVFWDMAEERGSLLWLVAFSASLQAAFLIHCFALLIAIPFGLVELFRMVRLRRIAWARWTALIVPAVIAVAAFVPLLQSYNQRLGLTMQVTHEFSRPALQRISLFYQDLLAPCITFVIIALALFVLGRSLPIRRFGRTNTILTIGFISLPLWGLALARLTGGPMYFRYFMSAVLGFSLLIGLGAGLCDRRWIRIAFAAVIACFLMKDCATTAWHYYRGWGDYLLEPATQITLNTTPGNPLSVHELLTAEAGSSIPILLPVKLDFQYLAYYWPSQLSRLYIVRELGPGKPDLVSHAICALCPLDPNQTEPFAQFAAAHPVYFIYGQRLAYPFLSRIATRGVVIESFRIDQVTGYFLAKVRELDPQANADNSEHFARYAARN